RAERRGPTSTRCVSFVPGRDERSCAAMQLDGRVASSRTPMAGVRVRRHSPHRNPGKGAVMVFCKSSFVTLCLVFSIILIACTDSSSRSPEPTEGREGQGNDDFIEVSVNELRALPPGERHTIDLRPDGAAFAVKF